MKDELKVIGKSFPLMEANEKVTGKYEYTDDMPAELYVKILRSPHPHALIKNIDTSKAEKLRGVEAVITHKDVPRRLMPRGCARACYILDEHVRFAGDEVAAVAATSMAIAEDALDLIDVEYQVLQAVFDPEEAARKDAPKIYPEGNVYGPQYAPLVERGIHAPLVLEWGDIAAGFGEADVVVEENFEMKPQLHSPLEPHVCIASWGGDELIVWNAQQCPWEVREGLASVLQIPEANVRIVSPAIGGAFGSKNLERYIPIAALLSKKAGGKRTKVVLTREECQCHVKRAWDKSYVKIGARKDGQITAILFRSYKDLGGYGNPIGGQCGFWLESPAISYKAENARFEGWDVHTNHLSTQPYRSVHLPSISFAIEQTIDIVAEKLGMDPVQFRINNMPGSGELMPPKEYVTTLYERAKLDVYPAKEIIQQVVEKIGWERWQGWGKPVAMNGSKRKGIGIAYASGWSGFCYDGFMSMSVAVNKDGSVNVISGAQDLGTGLNTTLRMLAAEYMGIDLEDVGILTGDTDTGQYDFFGARASRELTVGGHLLLSALEQLKERIRSAAASKLDARPEEIEVKATKVYVKGNEEKMIPLGELLTSSLTASASGPPGSAFPALAPGVKARNAVVQAVEVEVDIETGQVKPLKIVTGNCPGRMINPAVVEGQYCGGAMQSLGLAIYEEFKYDQENSAVLSCNYTDYRVPRAMDTPPIEHVILEEVVERPPHVGLPYGALGTGELAAWGQPAAVANAIYNAVGARIKMCPMTAEEVLEILGKEVNK